MGKVYVIHNEKLNWEDARKYCKDLGGDLASVVTASDEKRLGGFLQMNIADAAWVGAKRTGTETWRWLSGEAIELTNYKWDNEGDKTANKGEVCLALHSGGLGICTSISCQCTNVKPFICEMNTVDF